MSEITIGALRSAPQKEGNSINDVGNAVLQEYKNSISNDAGIFDSEDNNTDTQSGDLFESTKLHLNDSEYSYIIDAVDEEILLEEVKPNPLALNSKYDRQYEDALIEGERLYKAHFKNLNESERYISKMDAGKKKEYAAALEKILLHTEQEFQKIKDNNGHIARFYDYVKNELGFEYGSDAVQAHINQLKEKLSGLDKSENPDKDLSELYNQITGNYLNEEEEEQIKKTKDDPSAAKDLFSKSALMQRTKDYKDSSDNADDYASFALMSAVWAVPGLGIADLSAAAVTKMAFSFGMLPHIWDGATEKDGYSMQEFSADVLRTAAYTAVPYAADAAVTKLGLTGGLSKAASSVIGNTGTKLARTGADMFEGKYPFSAHELLTSAAKGAVTGLANLPAKEFTKKFGSWLPDMKISDKLSSNSPVSQYIAGIAENYVKNTASMSMRGFLSGCMSHLANCQIDGKEMKFADLLKKGITRMRNYSFTGFAGGGILLEQLAKNSQPLQNAAAALKLKDENGFDCTDYFDETGMLIARDVIINTEDGEPQIRRINLNYRA